MPFTFGYDLLTYGIQMYMFPLCWEDDDEPVVAHQAWLERQIRREQEPRQHRDCIRLDVASGVKRKHAHIISDAESSLSTDGPADGGNCQFEVTTVSMSRSIEAQPAPKMLPSFIVQDPVCNNGAMASVPSTDIATEADNNKPPSSDNVNPSDKGSQPDPLQVTSSGASSIEPDNRQNHSGSTKVEETESPTEVSTPRPSDVLFGRGRTIQDHPGNIRLHALIEKNRVRYEEAPKWEKTIIAAEIVAIIKDEKGRFLKSAPASFGGNGQRGGARKNPSWIVVDSDTARDKVSHTFRSRRTSDHHNNETYTSATSSSIPSIVPSSTPQCIAMNTNQFAIGFPAMAANHLGPINVNNLPQAWNNGGFFGPGTAKRPKF